MRLLKLGVLHRMHARVVVAQPLRLLVVLGAETTLVLARLFVRQQVPVELVAVVATGIRAPRVRTLEAVALGVLATIFGFIKLRVARLRHILCRVLLVISCVFFTIFCLVLVFCHSQFIV